MDYLTTSDLVALNTIHYPNIRIARGQTVFVKGPSGCGKTTLFHMLNGTLTPTGGTTETTTGTITVTAGDGIAKVTIGGQEFTVAQLDALSSASPSAIIDTGEGQLRITGISDKLGAPGAPTAATVTSNSMLKCFTRSERQARIAMSERIVRSRSSR